MRTREPTMSSRVRGAAKKTAMAVALLSLLGLLGGSDCVHSDSVAVHQLTPPGQHFEGPVWDEELGGLYFVDIAEQRLHLYKPGDGSLRGVRLGGPVSPVMVPLDGRRRKRSLIVGVGRQLQLVDWPASGFGSRLVRPPVVLAEVEADKPSNRFNDGKMDAEGRIWIGTLGRKAAFYRVTLTETGAAETGGSSGLHAEVVTVVSPVVNSNGLAWNADESLLYYIDSPTRRVDVFDFDRRNGTIANRRPAFDLAAHNVTGQADGMTIDSDGNLWMAVIGGGGEVIQVDPVPAGGRVLRRLAIPATQVTSVAFGDGDTLYVTTMRKGLSREQLRSQPGAGALFAVTGTGARRAGRVTDTERGRP